MIMPKIRKKLVLFDIDGTLLNCGKVWHDAFVLSVRKNLLHEGDLPFISFAGKTDPLIVREYISALAVFRPEHGADQLIEKVLHDYLEGVVREGERVKSEVELCPGVLDLLSYLSNFENVFVSSLTGNLREGAELKLDSVELRHWFDLDFGAFGSDHWNRTELPQIAVNRAFAKSGHRFFSKDIVIIGDTIHDIRCGRGLNVKSIAVGTGPNSDEFVLRNEHPDYYFRDMRNTEALARAILE